MTKSAVEVGVHEAKTRLSELLRLVDAGEEVVIARGGHPVARIVSIRDLGGREIGVDRGVFTVPDDFDAPLPDEIVDSFS